MPIGAILAEANKSIAIGVTGGKARLASLKVYQLKSVW